MILQKISASRWCACGLIVCDALRFMNANEELVYQFKVDQLRATLAVGESELREGRFTELLSEDLGEHFNKIKQRAVDSISNSKINLC